MHSQIPGIVDLLLDLGADAQAQDEVGRSPWDYAQENDVLANTNAYWRLKADMISVPIDIREDELVKILRESGLTRLNSGQTQQRNAN